MSKFELKSIPKLQKMLDIYYIIMYLKKYLINY